MNISGIFENTYLLVSNEINTKTYLKIKLSGLLYFIQNCMPFHKIIPKITIGGKKFDKIEIELFVDKSQCFF